MSNGESIFDYRDEDYPHESWDNFVVRKLKEQRTHKYSDAPLGDHLGGHLDKTHMDRGAFLFLKDIVGPEMGMKEVRTFVDIGCGTAGMVRYALDRGLQAIGVDGDYEVDAAAPVILHDFCDGPVELDWYFDIGWSVEFVEHIEEKYMDNWMCIFERCRMVAITYAPPDWPGHHHVNCQPEEYWIEQFEKRLLTYDKDTTMRMREASNMRKPFMQSRGLWFFNERDF